MKHLTPYMTDDGERYGVAKDQEEEFKADFGGRAQPVHAYRTSDGTTYTVSDAEAAEFARDFPDAEPVRRLSFANGKERDFTARELRSFMSGRGEFQTSDEFKADRDERDAKVRKRLAEGYAASTKGGETPVPVAADVPVLPFSEESVDTLAESAKGVAYMARKTVAPYISSFLTGAMRLMGRAMQSGVGMTPSLEGGTSVRFAPPKESGDIWIAAAKEIDAAVAPSAEDEKRAKESGLAIPGKVEEAAQGIGAFALAMHNLGPAVGTTLMSAQAGNDAYISLYDAGIANGLDPKDADSYANAGGAIATLGTAAMCRLPVSRLLGKFGLTKAPVADIERGMVGKTAVNNYSELVDAVTAGNMKKFLVDTAVVAGESGLIMGAQAYGVALAGAAEQGLDVGSGEVQRAAAWEGVKAGAEGAGIGALLGGMNYAAYKRAVRAGVAAEAQSAMYSPEGRAAWREFFPEGTTAMALKRALGKDISRADANKAGLPEMTARERNAIADLFVKDRVDAAKAAERQKLLGNGEPPAAPEPQKPQPKPLPSEPVPQTKEPVAKPEVKPEEPLPPAKPAEEAPVTVPPAEAATPPAEAVDAPEAVLKPSGDVAKDLAEISEDDLDTLINDALAERENGEAAATKPQTKIVNKGKGPVEVPVAPTETGATSAAATVPTEQPQTKPRMANKGKGLVPVAPTTAPADAPDAATAKTEARRVKERAKVSEGLSDDAAAAMGDLYDLFGASERVKGSLGMAARPVEGFDEELYNSRVRKGFDAILADLQSRGGGVKEFVQMVVGRLGGAARPYIHRFAADLKGAANGRPEGAEGGRDGIDRGRDENAGRGDGAAGALPTEPAGGQRGAQPGNQGAEHSLPAGVPNGQGGGGRDGVRPDGGVEGHGPDLGGMRPSSDPVGNRLATEDARTGSHAGQPSVVRAANGNIDTRASAPVRLSKAQRLKVNEEVKELVEKPVGSLTDAELDTLRQFTGAGGLGFKGKDAATQIAALNQHFTDYPLVDAVWNALEKAKVPMKKALEPSAGSGNFPGRRPELDWTLCELEPTAAKVLKHLFPGAKVMPGTFEDVKLADAQDVVISNFPFLEQRHHSNRSDIKTLHDFFFVHSAKQLKPNGVIAAITSTGTMDKLDPAVRRELMETCDVIGAFRLPQGTFASAGTDTAADVIFLQKRPDGVPPRPENKALNDAFVGTVEWPGSEGKVRVNGYFAERPEAILGDASAEQDMRYGGRETLAVRQSDATDLSQLAIDYKPYPVAKSHETNKGGDSSSGGKPKTDADEGAKPAYPRTVEGLEKAGVKYELSDGNGTFSQNIRMYDGVPHVKADEFTLDGYEEGTHMAKVFVPVEGENAKKIAALQHIVDDAAAFQAGDADAAKRGEAEIADYKERFGVHPTKDKELRKFFKDNGEEIYFRELTATFDEDFKPAESFRNKVKFEGSGRKHADENSSLIDQALASEDGSGEIRLGGERCKVAESDVGDLLQSGYSISGVDGGGKPILQNNVVFESGNLYKKIDAQKKMKESLPSYAAQIDAQVSRLESLLPVKKVFDAIPFKGNDGWTSQNEEGWVAPILRKAGIYIFRSVNEKSGMAEFSVSTPYQGGLTPDECDILGNYMSGKSLLKKKDDEADMAYLAREREAEGRLTDIYAKIRARVAEDPERVAEIERGYNERFNGYVKPDYAKAQYLIADTVKAFEAAGIRLRDNQKRWVTQALIEGVGINAHDVGGGKTLAAMALAHALKARGVCKKPMFVVPAKTIKTSWLNSANGMQKLFPNAKIVNLGSLPADKRTKALFDLANSTADAVFISHEGFEAIQLTPKDEEAALRRYADGLVDGSEDRKEAKQRESLEAYLEAVSKEKRDTRLTFDKLGVDCLIVDEAHNFKNVGVSSRLGTAGLGKAFGTKRDKKTGRYTIDSHRAHDFRFKADFVAERNNGRNVFLLTATPTPNKPIELYTMLRHLGRRVLGDYGIYTDRDFAAKFFALGKRECQATTGGTKPKTILTDLLDVYALKDIMTRYIDRIPMEAFAAQGIKLPEVVRETKFVDMSSDMEMVQDEINARVAAAAGSFTHEEGEDTVIGAFMNGRDAGVTPYVYGGRHARVRVEDRSHDPATDKIEYAIQETVHELNLGKKEGKPRTVIIFSDVQGGRDGRPSVPADIKQSLIARGMDPKEIAVVTGSVCTNPKSGQEVQASGKKAQELKGEIQDLFAPKGEKPAAPKIKVIIGSTASIGEGLNLNTWTTLSINLDVPMTPGAFKQREGRSVRFGNQHEKVRVVNLVTRGSYDTLSLSLVARKKGWNQAIWDADVKDTINIEDEMSSSAGIDPNEIIIESLRDPVEKIRRRVDYDLGKMANAVEQARAQVYSVDGRIATQKRNAQTAQTRIDERVTSVYKLKNEARALTDGVPALEEKAKRAFGDLAEYAAGTGEQAKADALKGLVRSVKDARAELAKEQAAAQKNTEAGYEKLDAAKKSLGAAKAALADGIKAFSDKDGQAFARIYANAEGAISSAQEKAASLLSSVPYHEGVIANAKRDIEAAEARVKELEAERDKAESLYKRTLDERNALGSEWYENFGTPEQQFILEKATIKAEMDAKNRAEDEAEDWMGVRQTIEAMPAPKSTGKKPLANGKLPGHGDFGPSGTTNTGKTVNRSQVFAFARELFPELHITNKGTYRRPGVLGWLEVENRVIRTIDPLSIPTLAHELGHGVVRLAGENLRSMSRAARREFIALGANLYGAKAPTGGYTSEGIAEFVRGFLCDYDLAKDFPEAHKWFFEDFGERNPDFVERLFALKGKILEYSGMTPEQKIRGMWDHKLPVSPSEIPWWRRCMRQDWKKNWVDSNWPLMRAVRECGADFNFHNPKYTPAERADMILNHPYMLATFFQGKAMRFAETDALACTTDIYGAETGVSLMDILVPIARNGKESLKEFWDFAVAMRGADYAKKGLEFGASRGEIAATIARHRSKEGFRDALKAITDWSHRVLHLLVDAGAITPEEYQKICDANPVYVPIHRVFAEADIDRRRKLSGKPGVFARKGGSQDIDAPATALVEMAARIRQAAMQAKIVNALVDMHDRVRAEGSKTLNRFMVEMPNPVKRTVVDANGIKDQIAKIAAARFGADADKLAAAMKDTWEDKLFVFTTKSYAGSQPNIVSIHDKTGRLRTFEVMDPGIVSVLKGYSEPERLTGLGKAGMMLANGIRMGATVLKGSFSLVANPIRDAQTAYHMSEYGVSVPGVATLEGVVNTALRTDLYKAFIRLGGDMGSFFQGGLHASAKDIAKVAQEANPFIRQMRKGIVAMVGDILSIPEVGARLTQFRMAKNYWEAQGVGTTAAELIARLVGGDITIDFGRAGDISRKINRQILFFNAAVREIDQLARAGGAARQLPWQNPGKIDWGKVNAGGDANERERIFNKQARANHAKRFLSRGATLAGFSLLAYLLNQNNEKDYRRFKELKPTYKWNNVVFGNVRLPVPFLDGLVFQSLPVAVLESMADGNTEPLKEVALEMARQMPISLGGWHQLLRNFSALSPEIDLVANRTWNESAIVPERMMRMDPRDWQNQNTTAFAKTVGNMAAEMLPEGMKEARQMFAPAYVDYLLDQHTGGLFGNLLRGFEAVTSKRGAVGVDGDWTRIPVVGRLFLSPFSSSRLPGDFYDELDALQAKHQSARLDAAGLGRLRAMEDVQEKYLGEFSAARRRILTEDMDERERQTLINKCSKSIIDTIRTFNETAKTADFRTRGVEAAAAALSERSVAESTAPSYRRVVSEVGYEAAANALHRYAARKAWSKKTLDGRLRNLYNNAQ